MAADADVLHQAGPDTGYALATVMPHAAIDEPVRSVVEQSLREALVTGPRGASVSAVDDIDAGTEALDRPFTILR